MVSALQPDASALGESASAANQPSYCNISQAAALLGVSRVSIWRWIRAGRLPVTRLGHRTTRIRREDLEQFLAAGRATTAHLRVVPDEAIGWHDQAGRDGQDAPRAMWGEMGAAKHVVQF